MILKYFKKYGGSYIFQKSSRGEELEEERTWRRKNLEKKEVFAVQLQIFYCCYKVKTHFIYACESKKMQNM
jgi:hypothetical protein